MPPTTIWTISTQGGLPRQITQAGAPAGGHSLPSWSPNGKTIAFVAFEGTTPPQLWTTAAVGGELKLLASEFSNPVYSADGNFIYGSSGSHIGGIFGLYRIGVSPNGEAAGERVLIKDTGLARIEGRVTISANGKEIAYNARTVNASLMSLPILPNKREAANSPTLLDPSTSYRKTLPAFSRDGRKIAFVEFRGGEQPKTWVMDADGRNAAQLTTGPGSAWGLKWLPDDDSIAFQSDRGGKAGIWSISISTGKEKLLLEPGQALGWPRLSPDGKQIAFNSTKGGAVNVWTLPLEGGAPRQLTFDSEQMGWPCWSPDGKLLALGMTRGADANIAIMPSTGGAVTQLTFRHGLNSPYDWSPDGDKIIFAGQNDSIWNVYWISLTTKQEKQLTHYTKRNEYVRYPAWSPLGNQIVYEYAETTGNVWLMELK